jgi:hypothetical protein
MGKLVVVLSVGGEEVGRTYDDPRTGAALTKASAKRVASEQARAHGPTAEVVVEVQHDATVGRLCGCARCEAERAASLAVSRANSAVQAYAWNPRDRKLGKAAVEAVRDRKLTLAALAAVQS